MINKKKIIQKALFKSLLLSDFLFINSISNLKNPFIQNHLMLKKSSLVQLTLIDLLKNVKQFLRLIQHVKKIKNNNLYFCMGNLFRLELLQKVFSIYSLNKNIFLTLDIPQNVDLIQKNSLNLLCHLNDVLLENKNLFKTLTIRHFFLNQKVNLSLNKKDLSSYKIYNNLDDFKKIIFIGIFLSKIMKS
jgi:predicted protein tyrosine phosphatase